VTLRSAGIGNVAGRGCPRRRGPSDLNPGKCRKKGPFQWNSRRRDRPQSCLFVSDWRKQAGPGFRRRGRKGARASTKRVRTHGRPSRRSQKKNLQRGEKGAEVGIWLAQNVPSQCSDWGGSDKGHIRGGKIHLKKKKRKGRLNMVDYEKSKGKTPKGGGHTPRPAR